MRHFLHAAASLAIAAAASVVSFPAAAGDCVVPLAVAEARVRAIVPPEALELERHAGAPVVAVLDRLNAEPPETGFAADTMVIVYWRGRPGALVMLGLGGCLSGRMMLPAVRARGLFGERL